MKRRRWHLVDPFGQPLKIMTKPDVIAELVTLLAITKAQAKSRVEEVSLLPDKRFIEPHGDGWTYELRLPTTK